MSERPSIPGRGIVIRIREDKRLFDIRMPNGYVAIAVLPRGGPVCPEEVLDLEVEVAYSAYDMSRCKIVRFGPFSPGVAVAEGEGDPGGISAEPVP